MSRHQNRVCDLCNETIIGEYYHITPRRTEKGMKHWGREDRIDVCLECFTVMAKGITDYYDNTEEDTRQDLYR